VRIRVNGGTRKKSPKVVDEDKLFWFNKNPQLNLCGIVDNEELMMKVRTSVKPMCDKCKVIKRNGIVRIVCQNPKHKQKQG